MSSKIVSREALKSIVSDLRSKGKKVGYTSGVFDILHAGHVAYLEAAKKQCDILIVGVNSDVSVQSIKGPLRPIQSEADRIRVISALTSVDYAFLFSESNNNLNIEVLQPALYIKAGDYESSKLSSAKIVEGYGGKVVLIPVTESTSTTSIVSRIVERFSDSHAASTVIPKEKRPALFIDRDGTLIDHVEYLHEPEKVKIIPGALSALKEAQSKGYRLVIVTNQPGIGLGYYTKEDLFSVNRAILHECSNAGVQIDKIYYCPHSKADKCSCRKPGIELITRAAHDLNIDLQKSFVIGDMTSDIQLAKAVGCKGVLVKTGRGGDDGLYEVKADITLSSLAELNASMLYP